MLMEAPSLRQIPAYSYAILYQICWLYTFLNLIPREPEETFVLLNDKRSEL